MTRTDYLNKGKRFLRKVIYYRRLLQARYYKNMSDNFCRTETANIENAIATIKRWDQLAHYFEKKEGVLRLMIPVDKKKWIEELNEFLYEQPIINL